MRFNDRQYKGWTTRLRAFLLGMKEFRSDLTSNPGDDLIDSYDRGRELAHRLTLRHWDSFNV